jgi:hypothetical protein
MKINKYIFYTICDKDIDLYEEFIKTLNDDYTNIINEIKEANKIANCQSIRSLIHKLVGIVGVMNDSNDEINYILKSILAIPKTTEDYNWYRDYIYMLLEFNKSNIGL